MVLVQRIRKRGANIVVEANGEVLFAPTGDVGNWTRRFTARVRAATIAAAPVNKRPRWAHYGKPLKATFTASTTYQPVRMKVYSAIGSNAPHAYYVDQGTGIYNGSSPYEAKILPPWQHDSPSLYERTWRPGGPASPRVRPVLIRGQKGQFFFDAGLKRGFESMRMRSFQVPDDGLITRALDSMPSGLLGFLGNTPSDAAFRASLDEWREWRDAAFKARQNLGVGSRFHEERRLAAQTVRAAQRERRKIRRATESAHRSRRWRDKQKSLEKPKSKPKPKPKPSKSKARLLDRAAFLKAMVDKYKKIDAGSVTYRDGYWYVTVWGKDDRGRDTWVEVRAKAKS